MPTSDDAATAPPRGRRRGRLLLAVAVLGLAATLAVTVPRGLDTADYRLTELAAATPVGAPVALVTLLVAAAGLWRARARGIRAAATLVTAAAAALLAVHLAWLAPYYIGAAPRADSARSVTVLAQNFEYGSPAGLAAAATAAHADIIVLSDMGSGQREAILQTSLAQDYPHRVGVDGTDHSGVAVLAKDPILSATVVDGDTNARLVRVDTAEAGEVDVLAFHPPPAYQGGAWRTAVDRVTRLVRQRTGSAAGTPLVVAGDLNGTSDNLPLRRLLAAGLRDSVEEANGGYRPTWPASGARKIGPLPIPPLVPIDHVFSGAGLVATGVEAVDTPGADHAGLSVTLRPRLG